MGGFVGFKPVNSHHIPHRLEFSTAVVTLVVKLSVQKFPETLQSSVLFEEAFGQLKTTSEGPVGAG